MLSVDRLCLASWISNWFSYVFKHLVSHLLSIKFMCIFTFHSYNVIVIGIVVLIAKGRKLRAQIKKL